MGNKVHKIYQKEHKSSNGSSIVYAYDKLLFPGDSGSQQEKHWSKHSYINKIEILVLGHHGSKTSTSDLLLTKLPKLKYAISSARYAKYRHPHNSVLARLNLHKIIVLKTEDWGNIIFEL